MVGGNSCKPEADLGTGGISWQWVFAEEIQGASLKVHGPFQAIRAQFILILLHVFMALNDHWAQDRTSSTFCKQPFPSPGCPCPAPSSFPGCTFKLNKSLLSQSDWIILFLKGNCAYHQIFVFFFSIYSFLAINCHLFKKMEKKKKMKYSLYITN